VNAAFAPHGFYLLATLFVVVEPVVVIVLTIAYR
jgi:NADH:ubiquinone oxidoreductase subunit 3 (subunit A)